MDSFGDILPYVFPFLFVGMWLIIVTVLRNIAGMKTHLEVEPGAPIRSSRWGSASINGVAARGCVKLEEYRDGFVVRIMWIFGGGRLWLPKLGLRISAEKPRRLFVPRSRVLVSGMDQVILYARLTDFVHASRPV